MYDDDDDDDNDELIEELETKFGLNIKINSKVIYFNSANLNITGNKAIWVVKSITGDYAEICRYSNRLSSFSTEIANLINIPNISYKELSILINDKDVAKYKLEQTKKYIKDNTRKSSIDLETNAETKKTNKQPKGQIMKTDIVSKNTTAVKTAAMITTGNTLNKVVKSKIRSQVPMIARGYLDTALGSLIVANIADFVVINMASTNTNAIKATRAMLDAAMIEFMASFNLDQIITDVMTNVQLDVETGE